MFMCHDRPRVCVRSVKRGPRRHAMFARLLATSGIYVLLEAVPFRPFFGKAVPRCFAESEKVSPSLLEVLRT